MRCLALAETMVSVGYEPVFLSSAETPAYAPALARSIMRLVPADAQSNGVAEARAAGCAPASIAIVDHYGLGYDDERAVASIADTVIACEDLPTRAHAAHIVIDPTPGRRATDYAGLVGPDISLCLGPRHALIRRPWRNARKALIEQDAQARGPFRILVSMGATDPTDATSRVLAAIASARIDCGIDVVLGEGAPHLDRVRGLAVAPVRLHVDPAGLPSLVAAAGLAIGAPGSSSFERAMLGVPSIVIPAADNQRDMAVALARTGAAHVIDGMLLDEPDRLGALVRDLRNDDRRRSELSQAALALCDGRGSSRLLALLAGQSQSRDGARIALRLTETDDCDWLLALQQRPETRAFARSPNGPSRAEHVRWFTRALADPDRFLMIVERDERACGFVRLDRRADDGPSPAYEVSIAIEPEWHGSGMGRAALRLARKMAPGAVIDATVLPANAASKALFLGAGYVQVGADLYRSLPQ